MATIFKLCPPKAIPPLSDGRDELNLAEFPITLLADRVSNDQKTLKFEDTIRDPKTGQPITRRLTITASAEYGLPTAKDDEVILAALQLTRRSNFAQPEIPFSERSITQMLAWPYNGKSFRRVQQSLKRWLGVTLYYEKAWWNHNTQAWVDENFHILERVSFSDSSPRSVAASQAELPFSFFTWSDVIFRSFQAGYIKRLDLDFYLGLKTSTAKRIFRFLDKRFYHGSRWEFALNEFAFEHIGLARRYHTGQIKEKLAPAITELEANGFLEPLLPIQRYIQLRRGQWKIILIKKQSATEQQKKKAALNPLEKELIDRGVTAGTAAELVAAHPADKIAYHIDVFDWMTENKDKHLSQNPAGYLVKRIRDDYAVPKGYTPKAERERQAEESKRKQQALGAKARREEQDRLAFKARRAHIDAYLKTLTPEEHKVLEQQAIANGDDETRRAAAHPSHPAYSLARLRLIDDEVLRIHPLPVQEPVQ